VIEKKRKNGELQKRGDAKEAAKGKTNSLMASQRKTTFTRGVESGKSGVHAEYAEMKLAGKNGLGGVSGRKRVTLHEGKSYDTKRNRWFSRRKDRRHAHETRWSLLPAGAKEKTGKILLATPI